MKIGAAQSWFKRRRGGAVENARKENGWRTTDSKAAGPARMDRKRDISGSPGGAGRGQGEPQSEPGNGDVPKEMRQTESTILVPFTVGSILQKKIQNSDDAFTALTGSRRMRVVESGGDKLGNLLGRQDPWRSKRYCKDQSCVPCKTRAWLREKEKEAKESNQKLPDILIKKSSPQCRREGCNYTLQCLLCIPLGRQTLYKGESSKSGRERQGQHQQGIDQGVVTNPLVLHTVKEHGGVRPSMAATIEQIEPRPLYRAVREAVKISQLPADSRNMNKCQEWGQPRVPVLAVTGGDRPGHWIEEGIDNPRKAWTEEIMMEISAGTKKRVRYWEYQEEKEDNTEQNNVHDHREKKSAEAQNPVPDPG